MYRLIIADDEEIECMVLEKMIHLEMKDEIQIVAIVKDGALLFDEAERLKPDIVIADINMPRLNGLDAIELLREKNPEIQVIIHTAYSKFSYAQKAVKLGACDYLVKPNLKEEIVESIQKAIGLLEKRKNSCEIRQKLDDVRMEKLMFSMFSKKQDSLEYKEFQKIYPAMEYGGVFTAWRAVREQQAAYYQIQTLPFGKVEIKSVYNLLKIKIRQQWECLYLIRENIFYCVLFPGKCNLDSKWQNRIAERIHFILMEMNWDFCVAVSDWKKENKLEDGIQECNYLLNHRTKKGIYFYTPGSKEDKKLFWRTEQKFAEISSLFQHKDVKYKNEKQKLSELLKAEILALKETENTFLYIKIRMLSEILLLEEKNKEISGNEIKNIMFWSRFREISDMEEIFQWSLNELYRIFQSDNCEKNEKKDSTYLNRALYYIWQNFDRDISLEECAEWVGISRFYLSRLIKDEKKMTFKEVLTDIRIREAVLLLLKKEEPIQKISEQIGYPNQRYFYKVFQKITGISLKEFRENIIDTI